MVGRISSPISRSVIARLRMKMLDETWGGSRLECSLHSTFLGFSTAVGTWYSTC